MVADAHSFYWIQKVTDVRYQELVRQQVVPQQTADETHSAMLQAKSSYEQQLAMQQYEIVRASFRRHRDRALRRSRYLDSAGNRHRRRHAQRDFLLVQQHVYANRLAGQPVAAEGLCLRPANRFVVHQ